MAGALPAVDGYACWLWAGGAEGSPVTLGISFGIPIYRDTNELLGVIDSDFSLNDLSAFL